MREEKVEIKLKVGELTNRSEVGRGIARMDMTAMKSLNIREGDIVELEGQKKTASIAVRAYPADVGLNIVRMDGLLRMNASVGLGEMTKIRKAEVKEAKKVVLAPAQKGILLTVSPNLLRQNLIMRPLVKGDIISPSPVYRKRTNTMFDEFFGVDVENFFFGLPIGFPGDIKLMVVKTQPEGIVKVTDVTEMELLTEAVEIDEKKIPSVTYEDIGGLGDAIQKIREMVELPLRHPELFERLGIEPPKGILLYGPPGTGKTLLARAVANESGANFSTISGPEIMSKWYGQSLPYNEEIMILEDGRIKKKSIGDIVENRNKDIKVLAFDEKGKTTFSDVTDLIKHKNNSKILEVKTRSGRKIKVTDYHSLFTLRGNKITPIKTSELIPGESYIAVPKTIPTVENPVGEINFLDTLRKDDFNLIVRNVKGYLKASIEKLGRKRVSEILGFREKYLYDVINKNVGVKISKFLELMDKASISVDYNKLKISSKGKSLPSKIKITKELCEFLGLWVAEGSFNEGEAVRVSIHQNEVDKILPLIENLFGKVTVYKNKYGQGADLYITHRVLTVFMKHVLDMQDGARKKKVPEFIFSLGKNNIAAFLRGYFSGDGSLYRNQHKVITVEGSTDSQKLANDLAYLLLCFGIVAKIYPRKREDHDAYRICFAGVQPLEKFKEIGFLDQNKNAMIHDYTKNVKWNRSYQVPMDSLIKSSLAGVADARPWALSSTIGIDKLESFTGQADISPDDMAKNRKLIDMDIYWDRVEEINEVENEEYVYDISVNPTQNFVAGFGGIFAHNSEENLRKIFEDAEKNAPSIIFIDEIDAIAPKREEVTGEVERRVVAQLLSLMDGMRKRGRVVVIAATNRENAIDPALRRPGRFDREVEIGVPDRKGRREVLQIHTRNMPLDKSVSIDELAARTHGFVGADVEALAKEAAISVLRRVLPEIRWREEGEIPNEIMEKLIVTSVDFENALKIVEPSAMREVLVEIPNVKWSDIGGLEELKERLQEVIEWPLQYPDAFKKMGIKPPHGVLLYGPPGCGKTLIVKAVANEAGLNFISVKGSELLSKWVGESEKAMREVFRRARQVAPAIVFFDEIDALAPRRGLEMGSRVTEQVVSQLLTEMSGIEDLHDVIVIAATNRPDILDPALLRPGRLDRHILVSAPDAANREKIFKVHTKSMPLAKDVTIDKLAKETEGYSGADIEALCREAAIAALREDIKAKEVKWRHFEGMMKVIKPSLSAELMRAYQAVFEKMKKPDKKDELQEQLSYVG